MIRSAKIMLLGDIAVGKTSLAKRLIFDRFDHDYKTTIGVNVLSHELQIEDGGQSAPMRLVIWDTDGDFSQAIFNSSYIIGASGAIVVADASRPATIDKLVSLVAAFEEKLPGRPVRAVLNKADLAANGDGVDRKPELKVRDIVRTSALTGAGVASLFTDLAAAIRRREL